MKILLGVTASVAATLTRKMVEALHAAGHEVEVVVTQNVDYFAGLSCLGVRVYRDRDEWPSERYEKDEKILHIELAKWADAFVIAPLTANTLAKLANGLADNLLTCVARAWPADKPLIVAPAMNTEMWKHKITASHLLAVRGFYDRLTVVPPIAKKLACGDVGVGAMANIRDIVSAVSSFSE
jgi:phosphopantothenoylcysteine decarboxylase